MSGYRKLTLNMSDEVYCSLQYLANETTGGDITEFLKRSVALQKCVWENRDADLVLVRGDQMRQILPWWETAK